MEKFVHKYLSQTYILVLTEIPKYSVFKFDGDALYKIEDNSKFRSFESPNLLLSELKTLFCLREDELKPIVLSWAKTLKEDVNLDRYWEYIDSLLPVARHVAARTLGTEIVSVQPLSAPIGVLMHMDYRYSVDPIDETISGGTGYYRVLEEETPQIEVKFNDRDNDNAIYRTVKKWSELINYPNSRIEES